MNKKLDALTIKLNWQVHELDEQRQKIQKEMQLLQDSIHDINMKLEQPRLSSGVIHPEFEINRLNFITQQQERKENLILELKNKQDLENKLKKQTQRLRCELKMLEKYLHRQKENHRDERIKTHHNTLDEWATQRENGYEN